MNPDLSERGFQDIGKLTRKVGFGKFPIRDDLIRYNVWYEIRECFGMKLEAELKLSKVREILEESYGVTAEILERSFWSHATVGYYIKDSESNEYVLKLNLDSPEKRENLEREIYLCNFFSDRLPTQQYVATKSGEKLLIAEKRLIRLSRYMHGVPPFEMTPEIFGKIVQVLNVIHATPLESIKIDLPHVKNMEECPLKENLAKDYFLHGDLTEANVLVADDEIVGVLDFELACVGPIEYDLSRSLVFCWGRMLDEKIEDLIKIIRDKYENGFSERVMLAFCVNHLEKRLEENVKNRPKYPNQNEWRQEHEYIQGMLDAFLRL